MRRGHVIRVRLSPPSNWGRTALPTPSSPTMRAATTCRPGWVDLCIVGTDRVTARGDVANKIGTYLKALAARDNGILLRGIAAFDDRLDTAGWIDIPIEERSADEVLTMSGRLSDGTVATVDIAAPGLPAANPAFDVTPARLVTGFITERGVAPATGEGLRALYPDA